jgi:hypothetical protein
VASSTPALLSQDQTSAQLEALQRASATNAGKTNLYRNRALAAARSTPTPRGLRMPRQPNIDRYRAAHSRSRLGLATPSAVFRSQGGATSFYGAGIVGQYDRNNRSIYVGQTSPLSSAAQGNAGAGAPVTYDPFTGTFSFQ